MSELNRPQTQIKDIIDELISVSHVRSTSTDEVFESSKCKGYEYSKRQVVNYLYRLEKLGAILREKGLKINEDKIKLV